MPHLVHIAMGRRGASTSRQMSPNQSEDPILFGVKDPKTRKPKLLAVP